VTAWMKLWLNRSLILVAVLACALAVAYLSMLGWSVGLFLWEATRPELNPAFGLEELIAGGEVACVAFSPDGKYLVAGTRGEEGARRPGQGGALKVWDMSKRAEVGSVSIDQWPAAVSFAPDGTRLPRPTP
jgi:WD40 repeat protein